jgi:hypothetical protein
VPFGLDLLFESEYAAPDNDFTGFQQLGPGGGTAVSVDFDGVEQTVNGIAFNESYEVWDPSAHPAPTGHNDAFGILSSAPVVIPSWSTPSHLIEFSIRDPLGNLESGGGINRDIFESGIIRYDDVNPDGTTPSGVDATVLFPADRHPRENDPASQLDGNATGFYFYYELNGAPANPTGDINFPAGVLQGDHPTKGATQQVFYIAYSVGQSDEDVTHDNGSGTFGLNSDTERELAAGFNMVALADALNMNGAADIDTVVFGQIYMMIAEGDGDSNGKVDGLDYLRWAANFGTTPVNTPLLESDGSFDPIQEAPSPDGRLDFKRFYGDYNNSGGEVDGLDYLKWAANFGFVGDGSDTLSAAVPEPSSLVLACFALAGMGLSVRRRR